jgi:hypothetical protein
MFGLLSTALTFHMVSVFEVAGLSRSEAITVFLPVSFTAVAVNIVSGWLSDWGPFQIQVEVLIRLAAGQSSSGRRRCCAPGYCPWEIHDYYRLGPIQGAVYDIGVCIMAAVFRQEKPGSDKQLQYVICGILWRHRPFNIRVVFQ